VAADGLIGINSNVGIEVIVDPKVVAAWPFPGWDGGDIGHTWLIKACTQDKPCK
jgi:hypothetical protein